MSELLEAFWAYERALNADDVEVLDQLFLDDPGTLRGDPGGLLIGHEQISAFRRSRGGAPVRRIADVQVRAMGEDAAVIVAVTAPKTGGRGLQTQLWTRTPAGWVIAVAHVSPPPTTFDPRVWRIVGDPLVPATGVGRLDGHTIAVKDLFAVAGFAVGGGVPEFLREQTLETAHASCVQRLLDAGASIRGIARTDQFAYSLEGDNPHYGTPPNAVVADALPGGSSSGSASAVGLGAATIGLATDTAGSIRVPASYQGLWGLRTTHGDVATDGLLPLAPDFDTIGLLTRTPDDLGLAASVLLADAPRRIPTRLGRTIDWASCKGEIPELSEWLEAFRVHQAYQAWQSHGAWLTAHPSALLAGAADRFAAAALVTKEQDAQAQEVLAIARRRLDDVLGSDVLLLPSAAGPAPRLWVSAAELQAYRQATLHLTVVAAIVGRPVVSAPLRRTMDGPVGTAFVGPRGTDLDLIDFARDYAGVDDYGDGNDDSND